MSNSFYNAGSFPATGAPATSASMRAELALIAGGFDKLPTLSGNGNKLVTINAGGTGMTVLTPPSGDLVGTTATQTLTNKTLNLASNTLVATSAQIAAAVTDETGSGALVFGTNPTISGATLTGGSLNNTPIGGSTPNSGAFTSLSSTGNTTLGDAVGDLVTVNGTTTFANANPTLSAGTANGVLYLDGSKVATSGSALTFDGSTFTVNSAASIGSNTAKTKFYSDSIYNGIFNGASLTAAESMYMGAGGLFFFTSGSEQMRLTSTGLGIGTSSPSTKLTVRGVTFTDNGVTGGASGLAYAISASSGSNFGQIGNTGTRWSLGYGPSLTALGTEVLVWDASGNVGIGTSSPTRKLTIYGAGASGVSASNPAIRLDNNTTGRSALYEASGDGNLYIWNSDTGAGSTVILRGSGSGTETARFDGSGNLGLGVTPSAWGGAKGFESGLVGNYFIGSTAASYTSIGTAAYYNGTNWIYARSTGASKYELLNNTHAWFTAPSGTAGNAISFTQAMTLSGTSAPALRVGVTADIQGFNFQAANTTGFSVHNSGSSATAAYFSAANNVTLTSAGNFAVINGTDGILFGAAATERARITSGGDLLVGTTSSSGDAGGIAVKNISGLGQIVFSNNSGVSDYVARFNYGSTPTLVGNITVSSTATAYNTSSDYRLKDNPQPLAGSGAFIDALQPKTWNWKANGSRGVGFIAHEVQAVSPNSVVGTKDAVDADGKPVMQAMEYGSAEFIANIIAELQSLRARVAALEAQP